MNSYFIKPRHREDKKTVLYRQVVLEWKSKVVGQLVKQGALACTCHVNTNLDPIIFLKSFMQVAT